MEDMRYVLSIKKRFCSLTVTIPYYTKFCKNELLVFANILDLFRSVWQMFHKKEFPWKLPKDKLYYRYVVFTSLIFVDKTVGLNVIFPPDAS
jgi:hypothetical protein